MRACMSGALLTNQRLCSSAPPSVKEPGEVFVVVCPREEKPEVEPPPSSSTLTVHLFIPGCRAAPPPVTVATLLLVFVSHNLFF